MGNYIFVVLTLVLSAGIGDNMMHDLLVVDDWLIGDHMFTLLYVSYREIHAEVIGLFGWDLSLWEAVHGALDIWKIK